jgi:DNA-binding FadR family transcriptional regulator
MPERRYRQVAGKIAKKIFSGEYCVGDRLPSERQLAGSFSIGRPVLREALIALELSGLVEVRQGAGIFVKSRTNQPLQMNVFDSGVSPFECLDARHLIEAEIAAQAAKIISDTDLIGLEHQLQLMRENIGNIDEFRAHDKEFHLLIAKAVRNSALTAVIDCLWDLHTSGPLWTKLLEIIPKAKQHAEGLDQHRAIYDALRRHDSDAAREAMLEHLNAAKESLMDGATKLRDVADVN